MDGHGFDQLTKRLARLISRREGLRVLLAGAGGASLLGLRAESADAACGGPGTRCKNGGPCCSGFCLRKKSKKGKKKGRCDCSLPQEACGDDSHCCFSTSTCGKNSCDPDDRCCESAGAECVDPCDCCFGFTCEGYTSTEFGVCVPCLQLQDACGANDRCCAEGSSCDSNGSASGDVCCAAAGFDCVEDDDCCGVRNCSTRFDNTCRTCAALGGYCGTPAGPGAKIDDNCCVKDAECFGNSCGADNVCCLPEGFACENECDCCEPYYCEAATKTCQFDLDGSRRLSAARQAETSQTGSSANEPVRESTKRRRSSKASSRRRRRR